MDKNSKIFGLLALMRPANIITAWSNILVGASVAFGIGADFQIFNFFEILNLNLLLLIVSTTGLYGGGVVLNDYFDSELDAKERPERPIPKGTISRTHALVFGLCLHLVGIIFAFLVSNISGVIAIVIALLTILYDSISKHHSFFGPLNMGVCRALNWILGMSILGTFLGSYYLIALIPLVYVFGITLVSRGEVIHGNIQNLYIGFGIYCFIILVISILGLSSGKTFGIYVFFMLIPFIYFYYQNVLKAILYALNENGKPEFVMKSVKAAVIGVIIVDAAVIVVFQGIILGALVLILLPLSKFVAKKFAVT